MRTIRAIGPELPSFSFSFQGRVGLSKNSKRSLSLQVHLMYKGLKYMPKCSYKHVKTCKFFRGTND